MGIFPPNGWVFYDMQGNIWQWCADSWRNNYHNVPNDGSPWIDHNDLNSLHIMRGGSWSSEPWNCRSANRGWYSGDILFNVLGFRMACIFSKI